MSRPKALIIDDEQDIRELIEMTLMGMGIDCTLAATIDDTLKKLKKQAFDFIITDVRLPDGSGMDIVAHVQRHYSDTPIAVITAHGNTDMAVEALKNGAFDFINKPFDLMRLREVVLTVLRSAEAPKEQPSPEALQDHPTENGSNANSNSKDIRIIGTSPSIIKLNQTIQKLSRSQSSIYIYGESGTGKELVAKNIHQQSIRSQGPFISVNCGAIPENLIESEFFGYKKGAFTGANKDKEGLFLAANGGTLFLDEVADLPLNMQVKLLRALQERTVRPIGSNQEESFDVRILSASHKRLSHMVEDKTFREDLYYRLNVISLGIPPLRQHKEDIPVLVEYILSRLAKTHDKDFDIQPKAEKELQDYHYPGNVRELENILERAVTFCEDEVITADDIQLTRQYDSDDSLSLDIDLTDNTDDILHAPQPINFPRDSRAMVDRHIEIPETIDNLSEYLDDIEKKIIQITLEQHHHDLSAAAAALGMTSSSLNYKINKHNIPQ